MRKFKEYAQLMRLDKPIGVLLLLWPTLWGLWLASYGRPNYFIVIIFLCGVILMRSAGCIINDLADRNLDAHVARTQNRPLATGKVHPVEALVLFCILILCAFTLVLFLNRLTIVLAMFGAILAVVYPFLKRVTHLPQFGLGMAFSWGIPMSFAALTNTIPISAWIVFFTALWWPMIYDTMYAMTDRRDDVKIGIKSTAILFGQYDRVIIGLLQLFFLILLIEVGRVFQLNHFYYSSLIVILGLFIYQQYLIVNRDPAQCFKAFLNNQWVGLIIFVGIMLSFL